jgi:hypothetical protein
MRVILRKERAYPGAQPRLTDPDGMRITAFVTNTRRGRLADLELRHRRRARAEDRIRAVKDTGLTNLPLHRVLIRNWCSLPFCRPTVFEGGFEVPTVDPAA